MVEGYSVIIQNCIVLFTYNVLGGTIFFFLEENSAFFTFNQWTECFPTKKWKMCSNCLLSCNDCDPLELLDLNKDAKGKG